MFEAQKGDIQVYRPGVLGKDEVFMLNFNEIKANQSKDMVLQDGDIVIVPHNNFKKGMRVFWDGVTSIFRVGTGF